MRFATKIGLSAAATALIVGPLLGTAMFLDARALLLERIVDNQVRLAAGVMEKIDHTLAMASDDLQLIVSDNFLRELLESPGRNGALADAVAGELEERAEQTGPWNGMSVFDREGRILFSPSALGGVGALADSPTTRAAFEHAMGGKPYHSDRIVCRRTGLPVVVLAVPVFGRKQPDRVVGVVAAHYVWAPIQDIIDRVEAPATLHLLNRKGEVIGQGRDASRDVRPLRLPAAEPERIALPGSGGGYAILLRGIHGGDAALVVDVPQRGSAGYRGAGWALLLEMPLEVLFTPIMTLARNTGLLVVGTLLLLAALFAVLGQRFIRPLGDLVQGVREVEQGRFGQKVVVRSRDEFGELAASFNDMAGRLRTTQEELVRREKLALLGQIALGVGDELRTPLGVMSNGVYLLREMIPESERGAREYLDMIESEVDRSERIVAGLMDAVSVLPPRMEMVAVGEVIEQALREVAIPAGVEIRLDIPEWLPQVRVDARQMQKVFRNLISNGVDAMPGGGVLEIRAHEEAAKSLLVSVRDTGVGIAPEQLGRLFQPLFSTKARGIGLGLVVVKNLTEANGGKVGVQSEAGKGTTFSIVLPVASGTGQGELRDHDTVAGPPPISE